MSVSTPGMAAPQDGDILKALIRFVYKSQILLTTGSPDSAATAYVGPPAKRGQPAEQTAKAA